MLRHTKSLTLCVTFYHEKKKDTFLSVYIYIVYRAVLIPTYKRTYDQTDQIEK